MEKHPLLRVQVWCVVVIALLLSLPALRAQSTYSDAFGTASYANNNGTANFSSDWVETNESTNPTSGRIQINGGRLRFQDLDDRYITRTLDLSFAISATLSLDYERTNGNESVAVQLFDGSSYSTIATLSGTGSINYTLSAAEISAFSGIRFISASGSWSSSETIFVDNVLFVATGGSTNDPPVVTATGSQVYCPGGSLPVVESISITDPDDTTAASVSIQISSGYVNGQDLLTLTGSHPSITPSWSAVEGKLTLTGPALLTEFEAAVAGVVYSSSSPAPTGSRIFSITIGDANYLPETGHFYEFVAVPGITWTAARNAAALRTYYGLQGYLATLTSQAEADFSGSQALGVGWIGATDDATEGDWQWVTGPEAGTSFWSGGVGGTELTFAFWNANEPNDYPDGPVTPGQENFAHITDPSVTSSPGSWNDLPNAGGGGAYAPQGYVVEYGGMPGDPVLNISDNTLITMDNVPPTASDPSPVTVYCSADIPVADVAVVSDEADNCGTTPTVTHVGDFSNGGTDPEIITRTYRVTDASGNYTDVVQTITVRPLAITSQPASWSGFAGQDALFSVSAANADSYQWQVSTDGGVVFTALSEGSLYSGTTTANLTVLGAQFEMSGWLYRVVVGQSASVACGPLVSNSALLTARPSGVLTNRRITYRVNPN